MRVFLHCNTYVCAIIILVFIQGQRKTLVPQVKYFKIPLESISVFSYSCDFFFIFFYLLFLFVFGSLKASILDMHACVCTNTHAYLSRRSYFSHAPFSVFCFVWMCARVSTKTFWFLFGISYKVVKVCLMFLSLWSYRDICIRVEIYAIHLHPLKASVILAVCFAFEY